MDKESRDLLHDNGGILGEAILNAGDNIGEDESKIALIWPHLYEKSLSEEFNSLLNA
jgi:hypothetical protein